MELPGLEPPQPAPPPARGVGGRQAGRRPRGGGGGYLNGRTPTELRGDPRLAELAEIGLSSIWLNVAAIVGYDGFMAMWRYLDGRPELRDDSNQILLSLRQYRTFEKYQRNRYIETLVASGLNASQVQYLVNRELRESLTNRQCRRLILKAKVRA